MKQSGHHTRISNRTDQPACSPYCRHRRVTSTQDTAYSLSSKPFVGREQIWCGRGPQYNGRQPQLESSPHVEPSSHSPLLPLEDCKAPGSGEWANMPFLWFSCIGNKHTVRQKWNSRQELDMEVLALAHPVRRSTQSLVICHRNVSVRSHLSSHYMIYVPLSWFLYIPGCLGFCCKGVVF